MLSGPPAGAREGNLPAARGAELLSAEGSQRNQTVPTSVERCGKYLPVEPWISCGDAGQVKIRRFGGDW